MKLMYTAGDLPFVLKYSKVADSEKRYVLRGKEEFIEFELPSHELAGLDQIEMKIDFQETFKDSYEENNKKRGRHGPGGLVFDN
ncbi:MAG: hypothetical protein IPJ71_15735 [Bdellovibrionales bacterium]|nr:hypothetical protein [Bdellovibrionales bacterium]